MPGFDLTFRAPKSVSLLWGLADPHVADEVRAAHDAAVTAALSYVEANAARSRRGAGGSERVKVDGVVAAAFRHRSSRAGDPLLHTHVLVANTARASDDGKWRTVDSRRLYAQARTAGFIYQAQLRHELTRRLGVTWRPVANGWADLTGVPDRVIRAFSQRRAQIEAHMAARGETSAAAAQTATLVTRAAKDPTVSFAALHDEWADRAEGLGFFPEHVQRMLGRRAPPVPTVAAIAEELLGPDELTERASTFDRRDVVRGWCDRLPAGAPIQTIELLTDALLADDNPHLVRLNDASGDDPRWTTVELLAIEQQALRTAIDRQAAATGVADRAAVDAAVARRPSLADEQAGMVRELTGSGRGVDVVIGKAGTGKTYALDAARDAWTTSGQQVIGCALAARAASELESGAGIPSTTLHVLLADLDSGGRLDRRTVVVVEEAGMVGTRQLALLFDHAARADAKVVVVGDPHQLPAIDAGGLLAGLAARLPTTELVENRRQHDAWERTALDQLRDGTPEPAVAAYTAHGRVHTADTADAVREQLVGDWWAARDEHGHDTAIMVAARRTDVEDLNARARQRMTAAGHLHGPRLDAHGRVFQVGDDVLCLRNDRRLGVTNGTRATITAIDHQLRSMALATTDGSTITVPAWYLDAGHLTHGYAITGHKAQGLTCDEAFVLGSDTLSREWGYTAMSRGRHRNHLYSVAAAPDPRLPALHDDDAKRLERRLRITHAKTLATDNLDLGLELF